VSHPNDPEERQAEAVGRTWQSSHRAPALAGTTFVSSVLPAAPARTVHRQQHGPQAPAAAPPPSGSGEGTHLVESGLLAVGQVLQAVAAPEGEYLRGIYNEGARAIAVERNVDTEAYGKHLLHDYGDGVVLHVHLGLHGKFSDGPGIPPPPTGEIRLRLWNTAHWLDLRGPAACQLLDPPEVAALLTRLGPDPLREDATPAAAWDAIRRSDRPLLALLMDQSIVAGAGLIYATEALFRAGLRPTTPGRRLRPKQWAELWADLQGLMRAGVAEGRIDTVHNAHTPEAMGWAPRVDRHGGEVYVSGHQRHGTQSRQGAVDPRRRPIRLPRRPDHPAPRPD
jgi:endonuclease VIII